MPENLGGNSYWHGVTSWNDITSSIEMTSMSGISSIDGRYDRLTTVVQTTLIAVISSAIILSNIINLIVLLSASAAMPWATRLFLINLSSSDLLVGVVACAPSVLPAATHRWTYGDVWCQVSGVVHGTSCAVSIWSIAMVGLHRFHDIFFSRTSPPFNRTVPRLH